MFADNAVPTVPLIVAAVTVGGIAVTNPDTMRSSNRKAPLPALALEPFNQPWILIVAELRSLCPVTVWFTVTSAAEVALTEKMSVPAT